MTLYAESSAVLSWLFGEPKGDEASRFLNAASAIFASELTLLECQRALRAAEARGRLNAMAVQEMRTRLEAATTSWNVHRIGAVIMDRACHPFPREPVRALDALHLATALRIADFQPELSVLTFDHRIRSNAAAFGLDVLPEDQEA